MLSIDRNAINPQSNNESSHVSAPPNAIASQLTDASNSSDALVNNYPNPQTAEEEEGNFQQALAESVTTAEEEENTRRTEAERLAEAARLAETERLAAAEEEENFQRALAESLSTAEEEENTRRAEAQRLAEAARLAEAERLAAAEEEESLQRAMAESLAMKQQLPLSHHEDAIERLASHLATEGYSIRDSNGEGNNCLFYSIVQCLLPADTDKDKIKQVAHALRAQYDSFNPASRGQGLYFDNKTVGATESGHASVIIELVNNQIAALLEQQQLAPLANDRQQGNEATFPLNIQIELIVPIIDTNDTPYGSMGKFQAAQATTQTISHNIRILEMPGHYQSILKQP
jgi:hypothetical protein